MIRCCELAEKAKGNVAPNPLVGAVLVHDGVIIGEGYHQQYGKPHAEVNCINSVSKNNEILISQSTLYVSLEPCAHYGKTPPCSDLIIKHNIPKVIIGCRDSFKEVNGKGIEKLQNAGVEVMVDVLKEKCYELNKRFFTFHTQHRPYIILKWAQTADNKIAFNSNERLFISNEFTNRLVHKWRSEEAAILVGTNTAMFDNPSLNNRLWGGNNPVRLIVDMNLRLPHDLNVFNNQQKTILFNSLKYQQQENTLYYQVTKDVNLVHQILNACYQMNIQSILVEGGVKLLQSFIDENLFDEVRVITNEELVVKDGLPAPSLKSIKLIAEEKIFNDKIEYFKLV